jgi:hypothetical protein
VSNQDKPNDQSGSSENRLEETQDKSNGILRKDISSEDHETHTARLRFAKKQGDSKREKGEASTSTDKYFKGQRLGLYDGQSQLVPENREVAIRKEALLAEKPLATDKSMKYELSSRNFQQFLGEDEQAALKHYCEQTNMSSEDIDEIRNQIKSVASHDAESRLMSLVDNHKVVCLGETHSPGKNWFRLFGAEVMPDLKRHGVTHLALELPESKQVQLDEFMNSGKLDYQEDADYVGLMKSAKECGIKLIAADSGDHLDRDQHMADTIQKILSDDRTNKVVFWVGAGHAAHNSPGVRTCLDILDEKIGYQNTVSVLGPSPTTDFINTITPDLKERIIFETEEVPRLNGAPTKEASKAASFGAYDYVLLDKQKRRAVFP